MERIFYTLSLCDSMTERGHCNNNGEKSGKKPKDGHVITLGEKIAW